MAALSGFPEQEPPETLVLTRAQLNEGFVEKVGTNGFVRRQYRLIRQLEDGKVLVAWPIPLSEPGA